MATARKGNFEVLDFTPLVDLVPRTPKLMSQLGLINDVSYGISTVAQVERIEDGTDAISAKPRGGDRNFAGKESGKVRNFFVPLFPLDIKFTAQDIQDFRKYGTADAPMTLQDRIIRTMGRIERSHATLKEKAIYSAIKGASYSPDWTQGQYDYASEFDVSGDVTTADIDFTTVTLPSSTIETARAHIIDYAKDNADSYQVIALCGRTWFEAFVTSDEIVDAYGGYPSQQEPLRKRLGGNLINRSFEHKGVTYIEVISSEIDTGDAYVMPLGISNMFQMHYAPADTVEYANTTAQEMYVFMLSDNHRTETIETETSMLCVNTRPELVVKSTGTFA